MLPLILFLATSANAAETLVDVPGVGNVSLKDASASCLSGTAMGDVVVARGNTRFPAFQVVAKGLAGTDTDTRTTYFKFNGSLDWPTNELQHLYVPKELPWVSIGVIGSCYAVGKHWVDIGVASAEKCKAKSCKPADISKEAKRFLVRACQFPEQAAREGLFIDMNDLHAARWACLQQVVLLSHSDLTDFSETNKCETPWTDVSGDTEFVTIYKDSDLGLAEADLTNQLKSATDRLKKMDPNPGTCGSGWAANWRKKLVDHWIAAQRSSACSDEMLSSEERATLCPELGG